MDEKYTARKDFKTWCNKTKTINSQDTINTYWNQIKKLPPFELEPLKSVKPVEREDTDADTEGEAYLEELQGKLDRNIKTQIQLQALRNFIECKRYYLENSENITDREHTRIKSKTIELVDHIGLDKTQERTREEKIEYHYIHKEDLVELLRRANPTRARYWASTYLLGVRWFASKTLTGNHFFRHRGDNGVVRIPEERTKSKNTRDIYLLSDLFWKVIEGAPKGDWEDRHGRIWEDVYFPDIKQSTENYQLGQKQNGKVYGLVGEIGLSPRTIHSFRHTRITDWVKAEDKTLKWAQDQAGHKDTASTNHYSDTKFLRDPMSLEQYCDENDIDLIEVIESEP